MPDKNNFGSLALIMGSGDDLLLYPGDANFESIPGIKSLDGKVYTLIATHHGSTVALGPKSVLGESIPKSSASNAYTLFSYAGGNTYGHDVKNAFPYYEKAGYGLFDATEVCNKTGQDTFEIRHFQKKWWAADNFLASPQIQATGQQLTPAVSGREIRPGLQATSMPEPPANWAETARKDRAVVTGEGASKQFPDVLTLTGSGGAAPKPDQDDLLPYAVTNEAGDIVIYDIIATKIILEKLPLVVPCSTDYPVTVQISCHDIEIRNTEPHAGVVPLVLFDVASGFEWAQAADLGQDGQPGNPGYAGGRVRLAVAGDWSRTGVGANAPIAGLSLQYRGGSSSSGQKGGAGVPGRSGKDGGVVATDLNGRISYGGPTPEDGANGGSGGKGGDAGAPGSIASSEVLAVGTQWPAGWKVAIDLGSPGTDSEYGKTGIAGKGMSMATVLFPKSSRQFCRLIPPTGGAGGPGGKGSKYTVANTSKTGRITGAESQQWSKADGKNGQNGVDGKPYDRSTVQFRKAKVNLRTIATEDEMLDQMAPVDWRFYSEG